MAIPGPSSTRAGRTSKQKEYTSEELLNEEFVEEGHLQAFASALAADDLNVEGGSGIQSPITPSTPAPSMRVRKVAALSDFAPINMRIKRRSKKERDKPARRKDWLYLLVRWPLLAFIFTFIAFEFGFYVLIRQLVNAKEWVTAWRGKKGQLRKKLRASRNYEEWKENAKVLDEYLGFHEWKKVDEDPFYDWRLVKKVRRSLKTLREKNDARGCLGVLETCIRANFGGIESQRIYSETFLGTKDLVESLITELEASLTFIRETPELSIDEKKRFFRSANTNLGISALCLSGGASFGYYHVGVVKAFLDAGLIPRVVTGTSAGGLIAALVCTRTDDELKALLVPELADRITACEEPYTVWAERFWKTGARFDSVQWAKKSMFFTRGSMTFKEAYLRTGRILNISVIPADQHSPTKLLNYMTAPNTLIWTALLASAAVPGILNPVVLLHKLKDGSVAPWNWGSRFKDGSLRVDIPLQSLNLYFNVTYPVVSQVNPHVHLFFFAPRGSAGKPVAHRKGKGKGWRGNFLLSAAEQWLKHELSKNFKVIRDLELLPQLLGQDWSSVFLQRFEGAVTIWPKTRVWDWVRILSDPDPPELARMIDVGQSVTWPKLHMIENRSKIEKQIFLGRQFVRRSLRGRSAHSDPKSLLLHNDPDLRPPGSIPTPSISPPHTSSEQPMSADPDAEAAFSRGSRWFYTRGHRTTPSPSSEVHEGPEHDPQGDPLRSPTIRRKWTSELLRPPSNESIGSSNGNPMERGKESRRARAGNFLSRLRRGSTTPPDGLEAQGSQEQLNRGSEHAWSSDSSSDDEYMMMSTSARYQRRSFPNFDDED